MRLILAIICIASIQNIWRKGGYMTEENFLRAKQIRIDIEAIKKQTISRGVSAETFKSWNKWAQWMIEKLEEEFKNL